CDVALFLGRDNAIHYYDDVEQAIKKYTEEENIT
ncbi:hypothetical protein ECP02989428_5078, partial [Escherichia coli P0298942.8]